MVALDVAHAVNREGTYGALESMRVLVLSTNTPRAAYVRYRFLQYVPTLLLAGIECDLAPLLSPSLELALYTRGAFARKAALLAAATLRRLIHVGRTRRYDVVLILREAHLFGPPVFEWLVNLLGRPFILDVDDAVWQPYDSPTYGRMARHLKCSWKYRGLLPKAAAVIAANSTVAGEALRFNRNVTRIPTVVDTEVYTVRETRMPGEPVVLGWIGSHSTARYLDDILPVLDRLAAVAPFRLRVVGAEREIPGRGFPIENVPWAADREVADVQSFDIGLFPINDDAWSRGKSAFKAVQYGAVGIPTVASPVTTSREVVLDGISGFHAGTQEQWFQALRELIVNQDLRTRFGLAARQHVMRHYSLRVHADRFRRVLLSACAGHDGSSGGP